MAKFLMVLFVVLGLYAGKAAAYSVGDMCGYYNGSPMYVVACTFHPNDYGPYYGACSDLFGTSNSSPCVIQETAMAFVHWYCLPVPYDDGCYNCPHSYYDPGCMAPWTSSSSNRVYRTCGRFMDNGVGDRYSCHWYWNETTEWGCAMGYYTTASSGSSSMTCTRCPLAKGSTYGTTLGAGFHKQSNCYVSGDVMAGSDTAGSYTYTDSECYYK